MRGVILFIFMTVATLAVRSQVWIPVTASDALSCEKCFQSIKNNSVHSSVTWKVTVKDNVISRTKVLFSETYYNKDGQPNKIIYFGEGNRPKSFTIVKYNSHNLPFEEVYFSMDSTMLGGVLYEYDNNNLLSTQISYSGSSVTSKYRIERTADSIMVAEVDSLDRIVSRGSISTIAYDQKELVFRRAQRPESIADDYDILAEVTRKHIVGAAEAKVFIYENDQVVKTTVFNHEGEEISSASFEYDSLSRISRIIERREKDGTTNVYMINYR